MWFCLQLPHSNIQKMIKEKNQCKTILVTKWIPINFQPIDF